MSDTYRRDDLRPDKRQSDYHIRVAREFSRAVERCIVARDGRKDGTR